MQYRTHLTTSLAISLPVLVNSGQLTFGNVVALSVGCLLPDIDEPHSWIGRRTRGVSDLINVLFGHRGMTHSVLGIGIISILVFLAVYLTPFSFEMGICLVAGYFLHLLEDSFSISGIKWFLPFSKKSFQSGFKVIYYKTGSFVEIVILFTTSAILLYQIYSIGIKTTELELAHLFGYIGSFF